MLIKVTTSRGAAGRKWCIVFIHLYNFFINILNGNNDGQEKLLNDYDLCRGVRAAPLRPKGRGGGAWHLAIL